MFRVVWCHCAALETLALLRFRLPTDQCTAGLTTAGRGRDSFTPPLQKIILSIIHFLWCFPALMAWQGALFNIITPSEGVGKTDRERAFGMFKCCFSFSCFDFPPLSLYACISSAHSGFTGGWCRLCTCASVSQHSLSLRCLHCLFLTYCNCLRSVSLSSQLSVHHNVFLEKCTAIFLY